MSPNSRVEVVALWVWRIVVVFLLAWVGHELRTVNRNMPAGIDVKTEAQILRITNDVDSMRQSLELIERTNRHR